MKRIIMVGATSGIGRALASLYVAEGWTVGLCGRRTSLLDELRNTLGSAVRVQPMDIADTMEARQRFDDLVSDLGGGVDLVIISAGTGFVDTDMAKGDGLFWVCSPEKAARQIYRALEKRKKVVYVTRRWRMFAMLLRLLPERVYRALLCSSQEKRSIP